MQASSRVVFNTVIQYFRTIVFAFVSLYTTRLILDALGVENYGIYALIGGLVSLLSFIQTSLSSTTQRFLSYYQGQSDIEMQRSVFNNSVITQLFLGIILVFILFAIKPLLFNGFLNIPDNRLDAAIWVYYCMIFILFLTILGTPFHATLIAHENILFVTIVLLFETIMKIPIALSLTWFQFDSLVQYAVLLAFMQIIVFMLSFLYCKRKYAESRTGSFLLFNIKVFREMFSYVGWTAYSMGCIVGRNQGIALVMNKFFGAAINAAYGLAFSVSGQISFISSSIQNAINPQIIKAEGAGNRSKMLRLSEISSKFSFTLLALISIPAIIEMQSLLAIWLKEIPKHTIGFCQFVLLANLIDNLTVGLTTANRAIGNIRSYTLIIYTIKLLTLPAAMLCLYLDLPVISVMVCFVGLELFSAFIRLPLLKLTGGLSILGYSRRVFLYLIAPTVLTIIACLLFSVNFDYKWSFLATFIISILVMTTSMFLWGLCKDEKAIVRTLFNGLVQKIVFGQKDKAY